MSEPTITVNGHTLTEGQAMSVRVAIEIFLLGLNDPKHLDEMGVTENLYADQLTLVRRMMTPVKLGG